MDARGDLAQNVFVVGKRRDPDASDDTMLVYFKMDSYHVCCTLMCFRINQHSRDLVFQKSIVGRTVVVSLSEDCLVITNQNDLIGFLSAFTGEDLQLSEKVSPEGFEIGPLLDDYGDELKGKCYKVSLQTNEYRQATLFTRNAHYQFQACNGEDLRNVDPWCQGSFIMPVSLVDLCVTHLSNLPGQNGMRILFQSGFHQTLYFDDKQILIHSVRSLEKAKRVFPNWRVYYGFLRYISKFDNMMVIVLNDSKRLGERLHIIWRNLDTLQEIHFVDNKNQFKRDGHPLDVEVNAVTLNVYLFQESTSQSFVVPYHDVQIREKELAFLNAVRLCLPFPVCLVELCWSYLCPRLDVQPHLNLASADKHPHMLALAGHGYLIFSALQH